MLSDNLPEVYESSIDLSGFRIQRLSQQFVARPYAPSRIPVNEDDRMFHGTLGCISCPCSQAAKVIGWVTADLGDVVRGSV